MRPLLILVFKLLYKNKIRCYIFIVGTWLSLVEHSVRDAGVAGSNPVVPTNLTTALDFARHVEITQFLPD